jgi:hypothetical protein
MEYISSQANQKMRKPLSKAGYSSKQSAYFHLVRVHNGMGPNAEFESELRTLCKGFTQQTIQQKQQAPRIPTTPAGEAVDAGIESKEESNDENDDDGADSDVEAKDDDDRDEFKQGKEPMSPELFGKVCSWLIEWGTVDAMFALSFFVHTWNLACRRHHTARIRLSHMSWNMFDSTQMNFKHTKTDKLGGGKREKRSIYFFPIPSSPISTTSSCWHCTWLQPSPRNNLEVKSCSLAWQAANQVVLPKF